MIEIQLVIDEKEAVYNSKTYTVIYRTRNGVEISCVVPNAAPTRIFQFMENLLKNNIEENSGN